MSHEIEMQWLIAQRLGFPNIYLLIKSSGTSFFWQTPFYIYLNDVNEKSASKLIRLTLGVCFDWLRSETRLATYLVISLI